MVGIKTLLASLGCAVRSAHGHYPTGYMSLTTTASVCENRCGFLLNVFFKITDMKELIEIQSRLKAPKKLWNKFGNYNYRSAEDILEAVKPLLKEYGCEMTISDEVVSIRERIYVKATVTINNGSGESRSVTAFAREDESKKGMDGSQLTGSTSSYARKYALNGMFLIDDCKDSDSLTPSAHEEEGLSEESAIVEVSQCTTLDQLALVWQKYTKRFPQICSNGGKLFTSVQNRAMELKSIEK